MSGDTDFGSNSTVRATRFIGDGTQITGITATVSGTPNTAATFNGLGSLVGTAQLSNSMGGTGVDSSGSTGLAKVSGGTWSFAGLVNGDVSASAAIARSKLDVGTPNQIVVNDGLGLFSSEAQVTASQGGLGGDFSAATGVVKFSTGTASATTIVNADIDASAAIDITKLHSGSTNAALVTDGTGAVTTIPYGTSSSASSLVERDSNQSIDVKQVTMSSSVANKRTELVSSVQTSNSTPTVVAAISAPSSGTHGTIYYVEAIVNCGDSTGGTNSGVFRASWSCKNVGGTMTLTAIDNTSVLDPGFAVSIGASASLNTINITVTGIAATTINWFARLTLVQQNF